MEYREELYRLTLTLILALMRLAGQQ